MRAENEENPTFLWNVTVSSYPALIFVAIKINTS